MSVIIDVFSTKKNEIKKFIGIFPKNKIINIDNSKYEIICENPTVASDVLGIFADNNEKFRIKLWISLDKNIFINITEKNVDKIIRYLYERYPY